MAAPTDALAVGNASSNRSSTDSTTFKPSAGNTDDTNTSQSSRAPGLVDNGAPICVPPSLVASAISIESSSSVASVIVDPAASALLRSADAVTRVLSATFSLGSGVSEPVVLSHSLMHLLLADVGIVVAVVVIGGSGAIDDGPDEMLKCSKLVRDSSSAALTAADIRCGGCCCRDRARCRLLAAVAAAAAAVAVPASWRCRVFAVTMAHAFTLAFDLLLVGAEADDEAERVVNLRSLACDETVGFALRQQFSLPSSVAVVAVLVVGETASCSSSSAGAAAIPAADPAVVPASATSSSSCCSTATAAGSASTAGTTTGTTGAEPAPPPIVRRVRRVSDAGVAMATTFVVALLLVLVACDKCTLL